MKLKVRGALFHCGRCGKSYSNPFGHECVSRMDRRGGKTTLSPKVSTSLGKCPKCRKPLGNPLTHTCTVRTDFKARTAKARKDEAAAKRAAARKARPEHRYEACRDEDCKRIPCTAYKEGDREGYDRGFPAGVAACPRSHEG
jgi:hypothetical protein